MFTLIRTRIKRIIAVLIAALTLSVLCIQPVRAQLGGLAELYLSFIMQYTYGTLNAVNNLPSYLNSLIMLSVNWQLPDDSKTTANIQGLFTTDTSTTEANPISQLRLQKRLAI